MVTERCSAVLTEPTAALVEQILQEGEEGLLDACRSAGLRGKLPNLYFLMREARAGRLEAIKVAGHWRTSGKRVQAWLARKQQPRQPAPVTVAAADANVVLGRYGLERGGAA